MTVEPPQDDSQPRTPESTRRADGRTKKNSIPLSNATHPTHPTYDLMYFGFGKVTVRGPVSGQLYEFTRLDPVRPVDARDAVSMLKTRLFRRIR